jgi:hypothetical protein|tara:strand:- start:391 stop:1014 length:624 start_codon:yes stop_codon:yes gene_type:complete
MTTTNALSRQPTKLDLASPAQFKFSIIKLPKVEYFCTSANIPEVSMPSATQSTPFRDIPVPGEKISFGDLNITFLIDENLDNYREMHGWLTGIGFPSDRQQYTNMLDANKDRFPVIGKESKATDPGKVVSGATPIGPIFSDATLNILSSKNRGNIEVRFSDVFPVSLSSLSFDQQATDVEYLSATATFQYKIYEFAQQGKQATDIVS